MSRLLHPVPGVPWTEIRAAAIDYVRHGWPVQPGTYRVDASTGWIGKRGSTRMEPISDTGCVAVGAEDDAFDMWSRRPYSVLLCCGLALSAVRVPAVTWRAMRPLLDTAGLVGPAVVAPGGHVLLLARGSTRVPPAECADIEVISSAWVALPPSSDASARYRWRVTPESVGWRLPLCRSVVSVMTHGSPPPGAVEPTRAEWPTRLAS